MFEKRGRWQWGRGWRGRRGGQGEFRGRGRGSEDGVWVWGKESKEGILGREGMWGRRK